MHASGTVESHIVNKIVPQGFVHKFWQIFHTSCNSETRLRAPTRLPSALILECELQPTRQQQSPLTKVSALIDTGCAVPIVFRKGLFADTVLEKASKPIRLLTASGEQLSGGTEGVHLQVTLPVRDFENKRFRAKCGTVWGVEAALSGYDVIVGHPFLALFQLLVDPAHECLRNLPSDAHTVDVALRKLQSLFDDSVNEESEKPSPVCRPLQGPFDLTSTQSSCQPPLLQQPLEPSAVLSRSVSTVASEQVFQSAVLARSDYTVSTDLFPCDCSNCNVALPVMSNQLPMPEEPLPSEDHRRMVEPLPGDELPPEGHRCVAETQTCEGNPTSLMELCAAYWELSHCMTPCEMVSTSVQTVPKERTVSKKSLSQKSSNTVECALAKDRCVDETSLDCQSDDVSWLLPPDRPCVTDWDTEHCPVSPIAKQSREKPVSTKPWKPSPRQSGAGFRTEHYTVCKEWMDRILQWSDLTPEIDVFATVQNARFEKHWTVEDDAFIQDWSQSTLWINPPFSRLTSVVDKIVLEASHGVMIVPVWTRFDWWALLGHIAVNWWDIPPDAPFFQDENGNMLPPRPGWNIRVVQFDAFGALEQLFRTRSWNQTESVDRVLNDSRVGIPSPCQQFQIETLQQLQEERLNVIETAQEHPEAKALLAQIQEDYGDVLNRQHLARDVDPKDRGKWGMAKIHLVDGAIPRKMRPFRMQQDREEVLREMLDRYEENGWIEPSNSEWSAQAFIVPKPKDPAKPGKQWRMVVDYRYLNSQTRNDPYPLPLIDNLIGKQLENRLWSVFDLQDGFHQMHLEPNSRKYTAFQTPWGSFQFTVLPMGVKNGPSMFQRMISWVLRDVPSAVVYVDDVLSGTPVREPGCLLRDHYRDVRDVLEAFRRHKLSVKGSKVHLFKQQIKFCGHILSNGTRRAAPSKLRAVADWTVDMITTVRRLKSFLGLAQYYSPYVKNFAEIAFPLTEKLKTPYSRKVIWTVEMVEAFNRIKRELLENVVLDIPDPSKQYVLETDACDYAVGGVLSQEDANGNLRPVAFFSLSSKVSQAKDSGPGASVRRRLTRLYCVYKNSDRG